MADVSEQQVLIPEAEEIIIQGIDFLVPKAEELI